LRRPEQPADRGGSGERPSIADSATGVIAEVIGLTKVYGSVTAVENVSFTINAGEIVGLLGPNGAGKTTTLLMLLGLVSPTSGTLRVFGRSFQQDRETILCRMNFCAPYISFPGRLTVYENLMVFAHLYQVAQPQKRVMQLLRQFQLEPLKDRPTLRLSSGQNTRLALCKSLLNQPRFLLLDEPTAYLDPQITGLVKYALKDLQERHGTGILYTTHNMQEAEEMCSRILFLQDGRIAARGSPLEVTRNLLDEAREAPALAEVFVRLAERRK
jgi:ABC-2 type transport system ATP-binding protein